MDDIFDKLLGASPATGALSLADLNRILRALCEIEDQVPGEPLTERQKKRLSPYLFMEGPLIVNGVADALRRTGLFPEIDLDPGPMDEGLARAARWLSIRMVALQLAACADRHYTVEMATQVKDALRVLRHVRGDAGREFGPKDELLAARRQGALSTPAEDYARRHPPTKKRSRRSRQARNLTLAAMGS